jgi:hypothetical protein
MSTGPLPALVAVEEAQLTLNLTWAPRTKLGCSGQPPSAVASICATPLELMPPPLLLLDAPPLELLLLPLPPLELELLLALPPLELLLLPSAS